MSLSKSFFNDADNILNDDRTLVSFPVGFRKRSDCHLHPPAEFQKLCFACSQFDPRKAGQMGRHQVTGVFLSTQL